MGQGFERFFNLKSNYSYRDTFFGSRSKHTKFAISNFFSFIQNNIIYHHHTQKAVHQVRKHHKKYIFGSAIGFLFVKVLITLLTTVAGGTFAQETNNKYFIGDGIISQYEQCDDSNLENSDGCDNAGQIEIGATCIGEPSICSIALDPTPNLVQTGDLVQTGNLEFSGNIIETGILEPIPDFIETGIFISTGDILTIENKLSDLDNIDLINYFYGSGSEFTSNRQNNKCILGDLNIVRLQSGYNTIPNFLAANTLYLLESGSYDTKYMINIENDCTALIGLESGVVLHTTVIKGANIKISSGQNNIIYNLTLNGSTSSTGIIHSGNNYGIFISSPDNAISNISSYDTIGFSIYMENFQNNIWNISRFDSLLSGELSNEVNTPIILPLEFTGDDIQFLLSGNGYIFTGDIRQGFRPFNLFQNSIFPERIDIYSIDYKIRLRISSETKLVNQSGSNFTGILLGPKTISISQIQDSFSGQDILSAFKIGSDQNFIKTQDYKTNSKDFSVSVLLDYISGSQNLSLYHSLDGQVRTSIESFNISDIDSGINLKFITDTFGQFAIVHNNSVQTGNGVTTGSLDLTGALIDTGIQDLLSGLNQSGIQSSGVGLVLTGDLDFTGNLVTTGILDQLTGKNIKGNIGDKIDKSITKGPKQFKDILTGSISSGEIITGTISTGIIADDNKDQFKIMDMASDKKLAFKNKLRLRGYNEDMYGEMIGSGSLDMSELSGEINAPVNILSTGNTNIEVQLPEGIIIKTASGINYTGILDIPQNTTGTTNIKFFRPNKYTKIGPNNQSIFLYDGSGADAYATVKIPTSGLAVGTSVQINYSENGTNRNYLTTTQVTSISGVNYAVFQTNHFTTFAVGTITWNNMKFLDDSFRDSNPSTGDIIKALYGSGSTDKTIYNSHWSANCQPTNVIYVQPYSVSGLNSMPVPAINTVYVLNSGSYIFSAVRALAGNCIGIIGKGTVRLYSTTNLTSIFTSASRSYIIYDNLSFHGYFNGTGGVHATKNTNGIRLTSPTNSTYNNIETQQHSSYGIYALTAPTRTLFNGIKSHSNASYGFYQAAGTYVDINASSFFNNDIGGVYYIGNSGALNNIQSFNNAGPGIRLYNGGTNILTNSQIYNNNTYGLSITRATNAASNMIIKDIQSFNNGSIGWYTNLSTNNKFYNSLKIYGNGTNNALPAGAVTGVINAFSGATTGALTTVGTTGCNSVTIPRNTVGQYYFTSSCTVRSSRTTFSGFVDFLNFSTGTLLQHTPYTMNGTTPRYNSSGLFMDSGYHVGEGFWDIRNYLLSKGYTEGAGALSSVPADTLVGSGYLNFQKTNGKTYKPIVLQSTGKLVAEVYLPKYSIIRSGSITANGTRYSYNGLLNVYNLSTGSATGLTGVKGVISFGLSTGLELTDFDGKYLTSIILLPITGLSADSQTFANIYRSYTGVNRTYIKTGNIETINSNKYVSFTSSGLTYFAAQVFTGLDIIAPILSPGYIFSGATGYNSPNYYYKGTIDIKADVTDAGGLNTGTCMYTIDASNRYATLYSGTSNTGYCYKTGIVGGSDLNIGFSMSDYSNQDLIGYSERSTYIYDIYSPNIYYQRGLEGGYQGQAAGVSVDSGGNSYVVGNFEGTGYFGSTTLVSSGLKDIFIAKISSTGSYLRAVKGGGIDDDRAAGVSVDSGGNSYVVGTFVGTGNFGGTTLVSSGFNDVFVSKISSTGAYLRAVKGGGIDGDRSAGVSVDSGGNSYVVGNFTLTGYFGSTVLFSSGGVDSFVSKISSTGAYLRTVKGGGLGQDYSRGVSVDSGGNIYIVGDFEQTATFGTTELTSSNRGDIFISKLSSTGSYLRTIQGMGSEKDRGAGIAVDNIGNVNVVGSFESDMTFGTTKLTNTNRQPNIFAIKISSTGLYLNIADGGGLGQDLAAGVAVDSIGNSYVVGSFNGSATFGSIILTGLNGENIFIAKIPTNLFKINNDAVYTDSVNVNLNIGCPKDIGVGGAQISYGDTTGTYGSRISCTTTQSYTLSELTGTKTVYMRTQDSFGNISADYSDTITLNESTGWNNNNFIDQTFWNTNPTNIDIIQAVYGNTINDKTAYNKYWSGNCNPSAISVVTVQNYNNSGIDIIPETLAANTIYLLLSGGHVKTTQIKPSTCSAIIGKGDVTLYSNDQPSGRPGSMIYVDGYTGVVIDNINIDGKNIISGGTHAINNYGMFSQNAILGITINNTEIMYSNSDAGIFFQQMGLNATVYINNLRSHKNTGNGLYFKSSGTGIKSMIVDNSQSYNNGGQGMLIENLGYITVNNSKFYNNISNGIFTRYESKYNAFNNVASFNNNGAGLYIDFNGYNLISNSYFYNNKKEGLLLANSSNNILNNIRSYNNDIGLRIEQRGNTNRYYGTLTFGYNTTSNYGGTNLSDSVLTGGTDGLMGRSNGSYTTTAGSMSCERVINPNNGISLLSGTCNTKSYITGRADATTGFGMTYTYGQYIPFQIKPVYYLDLSTITGSSLGFNTGVFITYDLGLASDSIPGLSTGYISLGSTGNNGSTLYYNGTIDVRADVVDTNGGLNTGTCMYTTGSNRASALYSGNTTSGYCYKTGIVGGADLNISFSIKNNLNTGYSITGTYLYDATPPSVGSFTINNSATYTNSTSVNLNISNCPSDGGVGGNTIYVANSASPSSTYSYTCTPGMTISSRGLTAGDATKTVYIRGVDNLGNLGSDFTDNIILDSTPAQVFTAAIYVGTTGYNNPNYYYKGIVAIKSDVNDASGISGSTCEYTTGSTRAAAIYSGTSNTGYCYNTGLNYTNNLTINFRVKNISNVLGTGTSTTYIYDATSPTGGSFTINNNTSYTNTTSITLNVTCPTDTGISNIKIAYGNSSNPSNWTTCTSTVGHNLTVGTGLKTVYVLFNDGLGNTTNEINKTITLDTTLPDIIFTGNNPSSGSIINGNNFMTQLQLYHDNGIGNFDYTYSGIVYDIYDSGLLLMYNFDKLTSLGESGTYVRDFSQYGKNGTVLGGAQRTASGVWNGAYGFDGTNNKYIFIDNGVGISLGTTHSINVWLKPSSNTGVVLGQMSGVNGLYISGSNIIYTPSQNNSVSFNANISLNTWTYISIVRSGTSVSLYKNSSLISTQSLSSNSSLDLFYIGKENNDGSNEKRYSGFIDELFIYNRQLSQQDISQLYRSNLSAIDTGKRLYSSNYSCVVTGGNYIYSGYVSDLASNSSGITRTNTITLPNPISNISASPVDLGQMQVSLIGHTLSGQSDGDFSVSDWKGNTGWYTNIILPLNLIGANNINNVISGSQIYFKSIGINTISGWSTNSIYVVGNLSGYVNVPSATTYIKRDLSDIPFMCPGGVYGSKPWLKVDVPESQAPDSYSGNITYDIVY